ncbi:MAG: DMT family transporter, partial [Deltaproteobacteria bacterium]|nr:DMT family transporter [Deltaproteobacteria bacterium]
MMPALSDAKNSMGIGAVATAAVAFSWGFTIVKAINMAGPALSMWRVAVGVVTLTAAAVVLRSKWPRELRWVLLAGLAMGIHQVLYILATQQTSISIVTLVGAVQPLLVALMAQFFVDEEFQWSLVGWSLLALAGIGVVVAANLSDPSRSLSGDLLAVGNIIVFTAYFLAAKRARLGGVGTLPLTATIMTVALVVVAPVAIATGNAVVPSGRDFLLICVLAIGSGNGHLLVNWAHDRVSATVASLILLIVPLLASVWAHLV